MSPTDIITLAETKGVQIKAVECKLKLTGTGSSAAELIDMIRENKEAILAHLDTRIRPPSEQREESEGSIPAGHELPTEELPLPVTMPTTE